MNSSFDVFLFLAEPFGFGPISSSIAIVRQLKALDPRKQCYFLGCGTSHQLATKSKVFDRVCFSAELSEGSIMACDGGLKPTNCLVVANTYLTSLADLTTAGFTCTFIDTLFWMWNELPIDLLTVRKYYIEDFDCADFRVDKFGSSDKFTLVPPLIDVSASPCPVSRRCLLISLGGIDTNLYGFPDFYEKLVEYISQSRSFDKFTIMVCGGGVKLHGDDFKKYESDRLTIECLEPNAYISRLKAATLVVASAGLHSYYELSSLRKNVLFLPPQSYSQYLQLNFINQNFRGVLSANYEQLGLSHKLREHMPEAERISEVKAVRRQLVSEKVLKRFFERFEAFCAGCVHTDWSTETDQLEERRSGPLMLAKELLSFEN